MTLPNGAAGLATIGLEFAFTNDGSIPGAPDRTQPNITEILKAQMQDSEGWLGAHSVAYAGLPEGVPLILGLLMKIAEQITGLPVVEWGSAGLEIIDDVFGAIGTFFSRITSLFPSLDFMLEGDWNPIDAIIDWITEDLFPLGLFMDANSPLDASKLFGLIPEALLGLIPFSHIGDAQPELLIAPTMDFIENVVGGGVWTWDGATGHTTNGCVKTTANGTERVLMSNQIPVSKHQKIDTSVWAKWSGLTYTGTPIRLQIKRYLNYVPVGVQDVASPPAPATNQATWVQFGDDSYDVPDDCDMIVVVLYVSATATAGDIWFDDASAKKVGFLKMLWTDGLPDLNSLAEQMRDIFAGVPIVPTLPIIQDIKDWWASMGMKTQNLDTLGVLAQGAVDGLTDIFEDMATLFGGDDLEAPDNPLSEAFQDFVGIFFRGGERQVVTQNRIAEPSGIPPMDSSVKIPWTYLPAELTTTALGMPWVQADKNGTNQNITASTLTLLTNWQQEPDQPTVLTFSGNKFTLPFDGMWMLEFQIRLSTFSATEGGRITIEQNGVEIRRKTFPGVDTVDICFPFPAATTDEFGVFIFTPHGSKQVLTAGTYIRATYMGMTTVPSLPPPPDPVTINNIGAGTEGMTDYFAYNHTFGPNSRSIMASISHQYSPPTVTVGGVNVPIKHTSAVLGNYFGFPARHSLAAAVLPESFKGTTKLVEYSFSADNATSANTMSFNHCNSIGNAVYKTGGSPAANIMVPANSTSLIAFGFGAMDVNFGTLAGGTQMFETNFVAFETWAHLMGYCTGGATPTATNNRWSAIAIEMHP